MLKAKFGKQNYSVSYGKLERLQGMLIVSKQKCSQRVIFLIKLFIFDITSQSRTPNQPTRRFSVPLAWIAKQ